MTAATPIWTPSADRYAAAPLTHFAADLGFNPPDYAGLWRWSTEQPAIFWQAVWDFCGVKAAKRGSATVENSDAMPGARWFPGAELNFAENLLREFPGSGDASEPLALIGCDERGRRTEVSRPELRRRVAQLASGLRAEGVVAGDRVAGFLPNCVEAVIGMLATTSLGAVWTSCSPDFGEAGVLDRFGQVAPKVLIACDGYRYSGKAIDTRERIGRIASAIPSLRRLLIVPFLDEQPDLAGLPLAVAFADYGTPGAALQFAPVPFAAPLFVLYSSGTTGKPKCIVHGVGGTLLQHLKEHVLQSDIRVGDRLFFYTTCGWMMWNWFISGLAAGATLVLYDGSPFWRQPSVLWELAERERMTHFGISPKYLAALAKSETRPRDTHDLSALRTILSTGSPLAPEQYDYVHDAIKADVQLASISGGTDIISCFALGNPWSPVYRGELQGPGLGMALEVWNDAGQRVHGEPGELVCTRPFPSMPIGFWDDAGGANYHKAYFQRFPGVWHHGDYAIASTTGGYVIQGRSDTTLNPGGVRIGTAEIYRVVDALPEVIESVVVGQRVDDDERVILFVRLIDGVQWTPELDKKIKNKIKTELTPRHTPARVIPCPEVPRTISGKITELAVRALIHGQPVKNAEALANPESLEFFRNLPQEALN
jgi:acetoacetyl-CoA synthetase